MGKLPIIPRGDTTRDDERTAIREREEKTATTATVVARFSAIADSAAADRDRRFPIANALTRGFASGERCARENSADSRPIGKIAADARVVIARRRRDAGIVGAITRLRRNTWHAEGESEAIEVIIDTLNKWRTNVSSNNVVESRISDGPDVLRNARIPGDEHTCCVAIDVPSFRARRHDRVERRNRRTGGILSTRSRSVGAIDIAQIEKILRNTVDSITGRRKNRDRIYVPFANVFKCDRRISPNDTTNIVFGIRESIDNGVNTEHIWTDSETDDDDPTDSASSSHRGGSSARLIEIATIESSCEKLPCIFGKGADNGASSFFSRLSAKIDPGGRKRVGTSGCLKNPLRIGFVLRAFLLGVFAMSLLCDAVLAAPSPSDVMENFGDGIEDERLTVSGNHLSDNELEIIKRSIVRGLGLQRIPDSSKVSHS